MNEHLRYEHMRDGYSVGPQNCRVDGPYPYKREADAGFFVLFWLGTKRFRVGYGVYLRFVAAGTIDELVETFTSQSAFNESWRRKAKATWKTVKCEGPGCDAAFKRRTTELEKSEHNYCSNVCANRVNKGGVKAKLVEVKCELPDCAELFVIRAWQKKARKHLFCSKQCARRGRTQKVTFKCAHEDCRVMVTRNPSRADRKFCSQRCWAKAELTGFSPKDREQYFQWLANRAVLNAPRQEG